MDFDNCRDTDSDLDCFEVDSIVEEVGAIEGDDTASTKDLLKKMIELIIKQHDEIKSLKQNQRKLQDMVVLNTNAIHKLDERTVELEKYSRKLCLIFHNIENKGDALRSILYLLKIVLQIKHQPSSIAACHPLNPNQNAPIIVKFIYYQDRDFVWRRRTWLKGISNSMERTIQFEKCLAPRDREIKSEAKQMILLAYKRRQDVFVYNQNHPNADAIQVKKTAELKDYVAIKNPKQDCIPTKPIQVQLTNHIETPKQPPTLTRKPSTLLPQF